MNTNHTPGPWKVISVDWTPSGNARFEIEGIHRTGIADARLIAAAPELLAVLERVQSMFSYQFEGGLTGCMADLSIDVRAAIAKATGEQQ